MSASDRFDSIRELVSEQTPEEFEEVVAQELRWLWQAACAAERGEELPQRRTLFPS